MRNLINNYISIIGFVQNFLDVLQNFWESLGQTFFNTHNKKRVFFACFMPCYIGQNDFYTV
jgi:hypothetical protein